MDETDYRSGVRATSCKVQQAAVTRCPFGEAEFDSRVAHKKPTGGAMVRLRGEAAITLAF